MDKNIMIEEALKLLERYKSLEGFPEEMNGDNVGGVHFRSGYNYCLEQCKLALLKKIDGIEYIIKNCNKTNDVYDLGNNHLIAKTNMTTDALIAKAIKDHLTK